MFNWLDSSDFNSDLAVATILKDYDLNALLKKDNALVSGISDSLMIRNSSH